MVDKNGGHGGHGLQLTKTEEIKFLVPVIYDNYMGTGKIILLKNAQIFQRSKAQKNFKKYALKECQKIEKI